MHRNKQRPPWVLMAKKSKPRHGDQLTIKKIARLKPGKHADGGGLALLVSDIGSKSWSFRFERNGRDRAGLVVVASVTVQRTGGIDFNLRRSLVFARDTGNQ
jgi:hypothetical protein